MYKACEYAERLCTNMYRYIKAFLALQDLVCTFCMFVCFDLLLTWSSQSRSLQDVTYIRNFGPTVLSLILCTHSVLLQEWIFGPVWLGGNVPEAWGNEFPRCQEKRRSLSFWEQFTRVGWGWLGSGETLLDPHHWALEWRRQHFPIRHSSCKTVLSADRPACSPVLGG